MKEKRKMTRGIIPLLLLLMATVPAVAQNQKLDLNVAANAGGTMTSSSYLIDFTIGEVITNALKSETIILTQGFHQASIETLTTDQGIVSGVNDLEFSESELSVYPNPVKTNLNIAYSFDSKVDMLVSIYDIMGKEMLNFEKSYSQGIQKVDLSALPKGVYFIKFFNAESQKLRTFKIIKS